jgi:hypothetical protein
MNCLAPIHCLESTWLACQRRAAFGQPVTLRLAAGPPRGQLATWTPAGIGATRWARGRLRVVAVLLYLSRVACQLGQKISVLLQSLHLFPFP